MGSVYAEFLKLKRSLAWVVVVALPLMAVLTGAANSLAAGQLAQGWDTLWLRVVVFYGLLPLPLGVAVLASLVWRVEHRGGNWNALMSRPVPSWQVVAGKLVVVAVLVAAMQAVLLVAVVAMGKLVFDLPGVLPARYVVAGLVAAVACLPVAAVQSGLSMLMRSFAAPIAVALVGAAGSLVLVLTGAQTLAMVVPYALTARATQLGTATFLDSGTMSAATVIPVVTAALVTTAALVAVTAAVLDRRDIR